MELGVKFIWVALKADERNLVFLRFDSVMRPFVSIIPFGREKGDATEVHKS